MTQNEISKLIFYFIHKCLITTRIRLDFKFFVLETTKMVLVFELDILTRVIYLRGIHFLRREEKVQNKLSF